MKQHLSNFDSAPLTCDPTVSSGKIIPNIAKSDRIFPGKGREDKDFILTCMDSSMAEVFPHCCLFFSILTIFRKKRELKVGSEVLTFFQLLYLESRFLSVAYLTAANLARLGISVHCQVSVRSKYLVRFLSQCWITGGHTIHQPIDRLLPPTGIELIPFQNSASKVAGLQVHATTPGFGSAPFP